jgi:hypothetical protein
MLDSTSASRARSSLMDRRNENATAVKSSLQTHLKNCSHSSLQEDPDHSLVLLPSCDLSSICIVHSLCPKTNPRGLVNHIRSGPAESYLRKPLRFRRRKLKIRANSMSFCKPCSQVRRFDTSVVARSRNFLLQHTMRNFLLQHTMTWIHLVKTIGRIR